jgi:DnaJ-domain-containing protein 1
VAAWFTWSGESICIPVDRYQWPEENLQAIFHVIEARRTELRHGTLHLVKATMKGFKALPPPPGSKGRRPWNEVLGLPSSASKEAIERAYREKAKTAHPDAGGSAEAMAEINRAKEEALAV